jgi:hypothetical protein
LRKPEVGGMTRVMPTTPDTAGAIMQREAAAECPI